MSQPLPQELDLYDLPSQDYTAPPPAGLRPEDAEEHLKQMARLQREKQQIEARLAAEIARLQARAAALLAPLDSGITWHQEALRGFLWSLGDVKTWKGLFGTLKRRQKPPHVEVTDADAYITWARSYEAALQARLLITKVTPSKTGAKEFYDSTGTCPPGTAMVPGEEAFSAEVAAE